MRWLGAQCVGAKPHRSSAARGHSSSARQAQDKPDKVNKENNPGRGPTGAASGAQAAPLQMPREAPRRPSGPPVAEANLLVIPIPSTTHECARVHARTHAQEPACRSRRAWMTPSGARPALRPHRSGPPASFDKPGKGASTANKGVSNIIHRTAQAPIKPVGKLAPIGSRQTLAPINNLAPLSRPSLTPLAKPPLAAVPVGAAAR